MSSSADMPSQDGWVPPCPTPEARGWRQTALWIAVASLAVAATVSAGRAFLIGDRADDNGSAFIEALDREADRLVPPVLLSRLAPFEWDHVSIIPPYTTTSRLARDLVGDEASELPETSEDELVIVFVADGRLAGWAKLDTRTDDLVGKGTRCLYNYEPLPRTTTYLAAQDNRLYFSSDTGQPRRGTPYQGCVKTQD